jgi:hypothetical protein
VDKAFSQEQVYSVVREIQNAGISVIGNYIFGLPEDDHATMRATLDLALDLKCEFANFYSAMAYPGSPLYATAVQRGVPLPTRWTGTRSTRATACRSRPRTCRPRGAAVPRRAFTEYYTDPSYLAMVGRRFGAKSVEELRRMTAVTLERDLLTGALEVEPALLPPDESQPAVAKLLQLARK